MPARRSRTLGDERPGSEEEGAGAVEDEDAAGGAGGRAVDGAGCCGGSDDGADGSGNGARRGIFERGGLSGGRGGCAHCRDATPRQANSGDRHGGRVDFIL